MENNNLTQAQAMYAVMKEACDALEIDYEAHELNFALTFTVTGEDVPIPIIMRLFPQNKVFSIISTLPCAVPKNKRDDFALAVCYINNMLVDGSFDFDYLEGRVLFRFTSSYYDSLISKSAVMHMLGLCIEQVDYYNDKLVRLALGSSLDDFKSFVRSGRR